MGNFDLTRNLPHLVVQPSDARLNPPEGYLFVQDALIISCGVLYAFMYAFGMARVVRDGVLPGTVKYLSLTLAYELFYAFTTTTTTFELVCFLIWFELDIVTVSVVLWRVYPQNQWKRIAVEMTVYMLLALAGLKYLTQLYPDEREQVTAYWTGIVLQLPCGWVYLYNLVSGRSILGHSIEMWLVRYIGCFTAYAVFIWRYLNVPQNWSYVASYWSIGIIIATLIPETVYPFMYIRVRNESLERERAEGNEKKIR